MWLMGLLLALCCVAASAGAIENAIKDPNGKTLALVLDCSTCEAPPADASCHTGVDAGFHNGARCGACLLDSNFGARIPYAYDLHITGRLKDEDGQPVTGKYVRLFLPNTWKVRTRTDEEGVFRMALGATVDRQGEPVVLELGDRALPKNSNTADYALYMVPEDYKPCGVKKK